ncbi:fatty acid cis/trans isomerase [Sphaerotilaceae bacterium SBD11-9]
MRSSPLALILVCLTGCAVLKQDALDARFGPADPTRFDRPVPMAPGGVSYRNEVRPILENRCVVCHGCYDAPCQLKLSAWEGVARGASKALVYDAARLTQAAPTRLFTDAQRASQWREQGFHSVLNERTPTPANNLAASLLYRSLALKQANPLPTDAVLSSKEFDFSLDRAQSCPRLDEVDAYEREHPRAGMPYGLPGLSEREHGVLTRWIAAGSPDDAALPLAPAIARQVGEWEQFLNGSSLKQQLMGRYLYEHLFLGHLIFEGDAERTVFRLVRAAQAPGTAAQPLATRRPFDAPGLPPGAGRVYYRLVPDRETVLAKTHMPYLLSPSRMAKYRGWFLDAAYRVDALPSYDEETASNPFISFADIPPESRYRFLLDEAEFFIMNFIKGPVCRGQMALDVIEDRFWVYFVNPHANAADESAEWLEREAENMRLPAAEGSNSGVLLAWRRLADGQDRLLAAKSAFLNQRFGGTHKIDLHSIWDGGQDGAGRNPNAALTVFRHFDSASVVKGHVGEPPKTAWVIGYPLFERIYYLLAAGYDPYGNVGHQLNSRLYMDFMRMEGESNFLMLLPKAVRKSTRDHWYRNVSEDTKAYVGGDRARFEAESGIRYRSNDPQRELYGLLKQRLAPVLTPRFDLASVPEAALRQNLQRLAAVRGASLSWLPEATLLRIDEAGREPRYFSLLRDTGHANVAHLLEPRDVLLPAENLLTVVPGFIGAYPNALLRATPAELPALTAAIAALSSEADYRALADRFVIRRTSTAFWAASDDLAAAYRRWSPLEAGLFDYNRLENR